MTINDWEKGEIKACNNKILVNKIKEAILFLECNHELTI